MPLDVSWTYEMSHDAVEVLADAAKRSLLASWIVLTREGFRSKTDTQDWLH